MIAITGATGYFGGHIARQLVDGHEPVRALVRDQRRLPDSLASRLSATEVDIFDRAAMRDALRGCHTLFHVAGVVAGRPWERVWQTNAEGPRVAVEAAAAAGVRRVVVTSTCTAIGPAPAGSVADESTASPPLGFVYVDTKRVGECKALLAGERFGVEVVVTNPSNGLGPPVDPARRATASARVVDNYLRGRLPMVLDSVLNFVDVEDVATGHLLAAQHGRPGKRYILGAHNVSWDHLVQRLRAISGVDYPVLVSSGRRAREIPANPLGRPLPGMVEGLRLMAQNWAFSSAAAERELGYHPSRTLDDTLTATVSWLTRDGQVAARDKMARLRRVLEAGVRAGVVPPGWRVA